MRKRDMIYITVEIQTSSVALHYLGVMIWENHIRELWEYFKLWKRTLNRAFMGWYWGCGKWPQIERMHQCLLIPTQRIYLVWNSFMILSFSFYVAVSDGQGPSFFCVCFQLSTQDTFVGQRHYDEKIIIEG